VIEFHHRDDIQYLVNHKLPCWQTVK